MTNYCTYDCAYCINRQSNDIARAALSVQELVDLTLAFYRRNYIEGLFLSSGVIKSADHTMERMVSVIEQLRVTHRFNGYIHMKSIPGASRELVDKAGLYADRLSVNIEIPSEQNLKLLAPQKDHQSVYRPSMKRVYYSGFIPVNDYDKRLPVVTQAPLLRENRLYQADWLMRFYRYSAHEIVDERSAQLDMDIDPKLGWALRHPEFFPVDLNQADYARILRVPGIGVKSARLIVNARKHGLLRMQAVQQMGVVMKRAWYFIRCLDSDWPLFKEINPVQIRLALSEKKRVQATAQQMTLFS